MAFDLDLAIMAHRGQQIAVGGELLHQEGRAAIDEALRDAIMKRIGEPILDGARPLLPLRGLGQPIRAMGDIGPGADMGDARHQGVDVAIEPIETLHLLRDPIHGKPLLRPRQMAIDLPEQPGMGIAHHLAEIGDLADLPEEPHHGRAGRQRRDLRLLREGLQGQMVVGIARRHESGRPGPLLEAAQEGPDRAEIEAPVAPEEARQRIETMALHGLDDLGLEGGKLARGAEGAVAHMAAGAAGDLGDLGGAEAARRMAVIFDEPRESDVIEIHIETHPDRIRRHEVIDLAGLKHADLGIAGARAQGTHHHRGTAALAPHHLGQGEDIGDGKSDDGAARRQARHLLGADMAQGREARPADELDFRHEAAQQRLDRIRAQEHSLVPAARMQQPCREDMSALGIAAELDLIDREKIHRAIERHRFDGAHEIGGMGRDDLLLARNEGYRPRTLQAHDAIVILAGQQTKGKADHAGGMAKHALDGEMGLAGVGGPEDRDDALGWGQSAHDPRIGCPGPKRKPSDNFSLGLPATPSSLW